MSCHTSFLQDEGTLNPTEAEQLEPLRRFWTDPKLNETDSFLRDYITQRKWKSDDPLRADERMPQRAPPKPAARLRVEGVSEPVFFFSRFCSFVWRVERLHR
jgi:hypothetical protein